MSPPTRRWPVPADRPPDNTLNKSLDNDGNERSAPWSPEPAHTTRPPATWRDGIEPDSLLAALSRGPDTSQAAGVMAPERRSEIYAAAHGHFVDAGPDGLTADELTQKMPDVHPPTVARRVSQLVADGLVVDSGVRRLTRRNAKAVAWIATSNPRDVAADEHAARALARHRGGAS